MISAVICNLFSLNVGYKDIGRLRLSIIALAGAALVGAEGLLLRLRWAKTEDWQAAGRVWRLGDSMSWDIPAATIMPSSPGLTLFTIYLAFTNV